MVESFISMFALAGNNLINRSVTFQRGPQPLQFRQGLKYCSKLKKKKVQLVSQCYQRYQWPCYGHDVGFGTSRRLMFDQSSSEQSIKRLKEVGFKSKLSSVPQECERGQIKPNVSLFLRTSRGRHCQVGRRYDALALVFAAGHYNFLPVLVNWMEKKVLFSRSWTELKYIDDVCLSVSICLQSFFLLLLLLLLLLLSLLLPLARGMQFRNLPT